VLEELSKKNWHSAYNVYKLIFENYIMFSVCDEMVIKATALFAEFFRLLHRGWGPKELKDQVKKDLCEADGDVLYQLATLFERQGWSEAQDGFPEKTPREDTLKIMGLNNFLGQTTIHRFGMGLETKREEQWELIEPRHLKAKDFFGRTALHYAAYSSDPSLFYNVFVGRVGDACDKLDSYGMTTLHIAAEAGNYELINTLIIKVNVSKDRMFLNRMALHISTERGNASVVRELIRAGVNTTIKAPGGQTALHIAVSRNRNDVVSMLLNVAGFDAVDDLGRTALHLAAMNSDLDKQLRKEKEVGDEVGDREGVGERKRGQDKEDKGDAGWVLELIKKLRNKKDVTDTMGKTALYLAVECKNYGIVRILVEGGVEVNARDTHGFSALDIAMQWGQEEVIHVLLDNGAGFDENTLDWAVTYEDEAEVCRLVKEGLNVNGSNTSGEMALRWAANRGKAKVVRMLLEKGADVHARDSHSRTPLQ